MVLWGGEIEKDGHITELEVSVDNGYGLSCLPCQGGAQVGNKGGFAALPLGTEKGDDFRMMGGSGVAQVLDGFPQFFTGEGLNHESAGAGTHEAGLGFGVPFPAHADDGGMGIGFLQIRQKGAVSFVINVQKDELRLEGLHLPHGIPRRSVPGGQFKARRIFDNAGKALQHDLVCFNQYGSISQDFSPPQEKSRLSQPPWLSDFSCFSTLPGLI